ncbi:anti-sigma factor antagonist [Mycobacterium branderi]|uniref:anti-sigma factor antagonist n=1 Tax=Mycobacterium branderi TaxID=43348 RepID=UPI0013D4A238|nr:anti-sigma factor antagonist [Mycobacterium branderi]MCV7234853.1 anti-sigma factor antagonist [Mycobacterium branderi]
MRATGERNGSAVIVCVGGEVDASNEAEWQHLLTNMAACAVAPGPLVVDVCDLDFIGAGAYAMLAREAERSKHRGVRLCLVSDRPETTRAVAACGLDELLPVETTLEAAMSQLTGKVR